MRVWHVFPTQVVCPSIGLVPAYGRYEGNPGPKIIDMKWPQRDDDYFYPKHHGDPFLKAFCSCQEENERESIPDLFELVKKKLKQRNKWPSKEFNIFQWIIKVAWWPRDGSHNRQLKTPVHLEHPWGFWTISLDYLRILISALDMTVWDGAPR